MGELQTLSLTIRILTLILCGSPFLSGCGIAARISAFNTNQQIKAASSVMQTASRELAKIQLSVPGSAPMSPSPLGSMPQPQPLAINLSLEDQTKLERAKRYEQELAEHEMEMSRLRRTYAHEMEMLKQDQLRERLRYKGSTNLLQEMNAQQVRRYFSASPEEW
ncbi:MAG: hypothetical protein HYY20_01470 [Candidatus Tectomicrobia bacterium]|uniref:Uncharacterized protein n=1 Tax=Tectimicrobiota bacterium TaxID=2528274 RepID=A0A932CLI2_UNCTE|nr:hypothetical protein [Candidatus Tectomicrobia bacterium]